MGEAWARLLVVGVRVSPLPDIDHSFSFFARHKRKHQRVPINFNKKVLDATLRVARKEGTTPANIVS
jgi:hypothetical protein